jgi:hypothetical protein
MAFSAFSGKLGSVKSTSTDVGEIRRWTLSAQAGSQSFGSSDTALTSGGISYKRTIGGTTEAGGTFDGLLNNTGSNTDWATYYVPGQTIATLKLFVDATHFFSMAAVITSASVNCDIDTGAPVSVTCGFKANGVITAPTF